jgi:hypothetical protein
MTILVESSDLSPISELGITQRRAAKIFAVSERHFRRWRSGDRQIPTGVAILLRLVAMRRVSLADVERAAGLVINGSASLKPPASFVMEPVPAQAALTRIEAAALANANSTTAEKVIALAPEACRWPHGDPRCPDFRFCGNPATQGSYCEQHSAAARLAYKTESPARFKGTNHATAPVALSVPPAGASTPQLVR